MWERLKEWRLRRTAAGVQDAGAPLDDFVAGYEDERGENITAIIAGKLAISDRVRHGQCDGRCAAAALCGAR